MFSGTTFLLPKYNSNRTVVLRQYLQFGMGNKLFFINSYPPSDMQCSVYPLKEVLHEKDTLQKLWPQVRMLRSSLIYNFENI